MDNKIVAFLNWLTRPLLSFPERLKTILGRPSLVAKSSKEARRYIDLSEWIEERRTSGPVSMWVRFAELGEREDLKKVVRNVDEGNVLLLDVKPIIQDKFVFREFTHEIASFVKDVEGDVAGVGDSLIIITPRGVKIDKEKIVPRARNYE